MIPQITSFGNKIYRNTAGESSFASVGRDHTSYIKGRFIGENIHRIFDIITVNNNSPIQDYVHPDDQTQPTFESDSWVQTFHTKRKLIMKKE